MALEIDEVRDQGNSASRNIEHEGGGQLTNLLESKQKDPEKISERQSPTACIDPL